MSRTHAWLQMYAMLFRVACCFLRSSRFILILLLSTSTLLWAVVPTSRVAGFKTFRIFNLSPFENPPRRSVSNFLCHQFELICLLSKLCHFVVWLSKGVYVMCSACQVCLTSPGNGATVNGLGVCYADACNGLNGGGNCAIVVTEWDLGYCQCNPGFSGIHCQISVLVCVKEERFCL